MNRLVQKFRQDLVGLAFVAMTLFLLFAFWSFNPQDPSLNSVGSALKVHNWCGIVGSFISDAIFQLFGITSWILLPGFARLAWLSFQRESLGFRQLKIVWGLLLLLTFSALSAVYFPETRIYQGQISVGGIIGAAVAKTLTPLFHPIGVQILLWFMTSVLIVFFSEKSILELTKGPRRVSFWMSRALKPALGKVFSVGLWKNAWKGLITASSSKNGDLKRKIETETKNKSLFVENIKSDAKTPEAEIESTFAEKQDTEIIIPNAKRRVVVNVKTPTKVENWKMPKVSEFIDDPPASRVKIDQNEIKEKARVLTEKLSLFGVTGEVTAAKPGPAVTMFEFKPDSSVKLSKITELEDDLSLALASESLRILAPIPGRDVVGIETSNRQRETVYMKDMFADNRFWSDEITLPLALGRRVDGAPEIVDLRKMPHLMVAGTTGSGKSVFTVSAITGLIYRHSPKTLKLILIDPKQVDLASFENIPHLALPVVTDSRQAVLALKWAVREMEKRYKSMSKFGARKIEEYNAAVAKLNKEQMQEHEQINHDLEGTPGKKSEMYYYHQLPLMVIVVEEFADLMTVDKANVEQSVVRLAQKARACGIHLMLCLQSPRKEFVTGAIKSNIPGRIAFKAASSMESRIILDEVGAERLLATGDMLYRGPGSSAIVRHHGPFLKDTDIKDSTKFWSDQAPPEYDSSAMQALEGSSGDGSVGGEAGDFSEETQDDRYDEIIGWLQTQKEVSASLIQRRFQLGYPRAARLIETFERQGVVGPANGSKPRQVLIHNLKDLGA